MTEMKMALIFHCRSCEKVFPRITITIVHITSPTVLLSMFSPCSEEKTVIAKHWLFNCAPCNNPHSLYFHQILAFILQKTQNVIVIFCFHHVATQDPNVYCPKQISPCSNSKFWSWHQICDTSLLCIALLVHLKIKFCVFE